jgi:hypothetical protein
MPLIIFVLFILCIVDEVYQPILPYIPVLTDDEWLTAKVAAIAAIYYWHKAKKKQNE